MDLGSIIEIILILGISGFAFYQLKNKKEEVNPQEAILREEIGELKAELNAEKSEKERLSEQGKQLFVQLKDLKTDLRIMQERNEKLNEDLSKFRAEENRKESEFLNKLNKLEEAKNSLEEEKRRIRKEDEERMAKVIADRDRMWAEHEENVLNMLSALCKAPQFNFATYDNNNLPDDFDGKLKPDFMIEFLNQYVIFDAKTTKSDNLQTYISDQVKKTAAKIQNNNKIYPTIFFVVPVDAINQLKVHHYFEGGFSFYIVSSEAVAPILASFKKIETYEFAEQMDPLERENIINLIADLDQHINFTNAAQLLLTKRGINSLEKIKKLDPQILEEVERKKEKMRLKSFKPTDIKNFMLGTEVQEKAIRKHVSPKALVEDSDIAEARALLEG